MGTSEELGWIPRCGIAAAVAASLVLLMLALPLGAAGFVTEAFAGGTLIYLYLRREPKEWLWVGGLAAVFGWIYHRSGAAVSYWDGWDVSFPAALCCLACLVVLFYRSASEPGPRRQEAFATMREVALIPAMCLCAIATVSFNIYVTPKIYDNLLYAFDRNLGINASFAMGQFFREHHWLAYLSSLVYSALPVNLCFLCALQARHKPAQAADVRVAFVALGVLGFFLYQLCPAVGPVFVFGASFPTHAPAYLAPGPAPMAPRNAVPSLHLAWCLLVLYNSWPRSVGVKLYALLCLGLTAAATLGLGQHYLVDLVVAVPLSVAVQLGCSSPRRIPAAAACLGIVLMWLAALRTGILGHLPPGLAWTLVGATLIASVALGRPRELAAAQHRTQTSGRTTLTGGWAPAPE